MKDDTTMILSDSKLDLQIQLELALWSNRRIEREIESHRCVLSALEDEKQENDDTIARVMGLLDRAGQSDS